MGQWGTLSYTTENASFARDILITAISQPQTLDGETKQSRNKRFFYPRSHMPGDFTVEGICVSQASYQELALFIRKHQIAMLNTPPADRFSRVGQGGYNRLLLLTVPTEQIKIRGFVPQFGMKKKGVFEPAPTYSFNLFVVFDDTARNIGLSNRVQRYYAKGAHT